MSDALLKKTDLLEQLQRQLDEIEALRAVFSDCGGEGPCSGSGGCGGGGGGAAGEAWGLLLDVPERQALELAQQVCEAAAAAAAVRDNLRPSGDPDVGRGDGGGSGGDEDRGLLEGLPLLSGAVKPPGLLYGGQSVGLRFALPRGYPAASAPWATPSAGAIAGHSQPRPHLHRQALLAVECGGPRHVHERLSCAVRQVAEAEAEAGCECLLLALDALKDAVEELLAAPPQQRGPEAAAGEATPGGPAGAGQNHNGGSSGGGGSGLSKAPAVTPGGRETATAAGVMTREQDEAKKEEAEGLLCSLVWLHHLKSLTKRKLIVQWARELALAGACKPGFPGVVVVEGHSSDVHDFLDRMRSLSWQAMQVRGQDLVPLPPPSASQAPQQQQHEHQQQRMARVEAARRLRSPLPFVELDEGGMSELGALCRAAGLHHVFLTALKL